MMIGAKDLAFPRINLLSWYLYIAGGTLMLLCIPDWRSRYGLDFLYAIQYGFSNTNVTEAGLAIFINGFRRS